ncbi:MAG TPA: endonuclease/exonuclease/phosphatase family protein [Dongiaceae bacterium]
MAPHLRNIVPSLALLEHFTAQLTAVCALGCFAALALRLRIRATLAGVMTLWNLLAIAPFLDFTGLSAGATAAPAQMPLKVLSLNLWVKNPDHGRTVDFLQQSGADVIGLVEVTPSWLASLQSLETTYPYHLDCVIQVPHCGVAFYSKLPFQAGFAGRIGARVPTAVTVTIDRGGKPLTLTEVQLTDPLKSGTEAQARQADVLGDYLAAHAVHSGSGGQVVMGDFNSAPWSLLQDELRAKTGLDNSGRLAFSWPSWAPAIFRLPIDQIFVSDGVIIRDYRAGPAVGSDHLPIEAEIATKP